MRIIDFGKTDKQLKRFIKDHNARQDERTAQLRVGPVGTAKELIKLYGSALIKAHGIGSLNPIKLPSVRTNNVQLAHLTEASPRTIQRHIKKLLEAKVITAKIFHGSNADYELWLNPDLLVLTPVARALFGLEIENPAPENPLVPASFPPNCRHTDTGDLRTNRLIAVGNPQHLLKTPIALSPRQLQSRKRSSLPLTHKKSGDIFTGDTEEEVEKKLNPSQEAEEEAPLVRDVSLAESTSETQPDRGASLLFFAGLLWTLARNVLYRDMYLSDWQQKRALELIVQFYQPVSPAKMQLVHELYCERITLVQRFVQRDPRNRFVQLPHRFFDKTNASGFTGTRQWGILQQKRKKEVRLELVLAAQIRKYRNNLSREESKRKPPLQVFRECETRLGKLGHPQLVDRFYASVIEPEQFSQIQPFTQPVLQLTT